MAAAAQGEKQAPPVKVNVLNVCTPGEADLKEMKAALARIPRQPRFSGDYEVSRGHTTIETGSNWVRLRRDFAPGVPFNAAQYLFNSDDQATRETVVFFSKDSKGITQIALEDRVSPASNPQTMLATRTPVNRISMERFGKTHLVVTRCEDTDQSALLPLFETATELVAQYRALTNAKEIVPVEFGRLSLSPGPGYRPPKVKPMGKRK